MSNVAVIREGYEAWNGRDIDGVLAHIHENVEWCLDADVLIPEAEKLCHGHEGVRQLWNLWMDPWESMTIEPKELIEEGEIVLAFVRFKAVGRGSGVPVEAEFTHVWELDAGKVKRFAHYTERGKALRHTGLGTGRTS